MTGLINGAQKIAKGSILDVANQTGKSFAESFLDCDAIIAVDVSASMSTRDCQENASRFDMAVREEKLHPTQKPKELFKYLINTYTNEGMTVLDATAGSCTTALACKELNRKFICIEKEQKYVDIGNERLINAQPSLFF